MSAHANLDDAAHREAQELLPWLANGTLDGAELARVEAHVGHCAACRADLDTLATLRERADLPLPGLDVDAALGRLLPQLDEAAPAPVTALPAARGWRARLAANDARWLRAAAGLQFGVIVVLGALLLRPGGETDPQAGDYRVLGADAGAAGTLIVTFKPDTPERELRRIVIGSGAQVAGGPTVTGAWVLATTQAPAEVAARLRQQPAVVLAEPLGAGAPP